MSGREHLLVVDGYNVLGAWPALTQGRTLEEARDALIERLSDYAGYSGQRVVVVFDAWQSDRRQRTQEKRGRLEVVFTQRGETADHYIERLCDESARLVDLGRLEVRVATSDGVEQTVVLGRGASRLSARELLYEMEHVRKSGRLSAQRVQPVKKHPLMERLPEEVRERLERMRRGE